MAVLPSSRIQLRQDHPETDGLLGIFQVGKRHNDMNWDWFGKKMYHNTLSLSLFVWEKGTKFIWLIDLPLENMGAKRKTWFFKASLLL